MTRTCIRLAAGLGGLTVAAAAHAQPAGMGPGMWSNGPGWGHMVFGSLMMLLFWGALVLAVVLAVRWIAGSHGDGESRSSRSRALTILEERFARGEIDKDEFQERKRALSD